jgi:hypothetical protein
MAKQQAVTQVNPDVASLIMVKVPTQWTYGEGRCSVVGRMEAATEAFRGSRGGMLRKISSAVLEARYGDAGGGSTAAYKGDRSRGGPYRESEGFKVPFEGTGHRVAGRTNATDSNAEEVE